MTVFPDPSDCLGSTSFIDSDSPSIVACLDEIGIKKSSAEQRAVEVFEYVRDEIEYEFGIRHTPEEFAASFTLKDGKGFCVRKAVLLCALGRAAGIPSAIILSDMRDRSLSPRVRDSLGTDVMYHHGLTAMFLNGRWLRVDASLSPDIYIRKAYRPVVFDGISDALQADTTLSGDPHAEYLEFHGIYADLPYEQMMSAYVKKYSEAKFSTLQGVRLDD